MQIHPNNATSRDRILADTALVDIDTVASLSATMAGGQRQTLSAVLINDLAEAEFTISAVGDLDISIKHVNIWYQAPSRWNNIGNSTFTPPIEGYLCPGLLLNDPVLVTSVTDADLTECHSYVKLEGGGTELLTDRAIVSTGSSNRVTRLAPDFAVADAATLQPVTLSTGVNHQIVINVHIPENTPAGELTSTLEVRKDGGIVASELITIQVAAFNLGAPKMEYSVYHRGKRQADTLTPNSGSEFKDQTQMRAELANMVEYGITNPNTYQSIKLGSSEADFKQYLDDRAAAGMDLANFYPIDLSTYSADDQTGIDAMVAEIATVTGWCAGYGLGQLWVSGKDERTGTDLTDQFPAYSAAQAAGAKTWAAINFADIALSDGYVDKLVIADAPAQSNAASAHALGVEAYCYANYQSGPENPYLWHLNYGVCLWAGNYDGCMIYAYQDSMGDGWNDFDDDVYRDHNLTYPAKYEPFNTLAMVGFREASNDAKFIARLEDAIDDAPPYLSSEAATAQAYLDGEKTTIAAQNVAGDKTAWGFNYDMTLFRNTVIAHTETLLAMALTNPSNTPTTTGATITCDSANTDGAVYSALRLNSAWENTDADRLAVFLAESGYYPDVVGTRSDTTLTPEETYTDMSPGQVGYVGWVQDASAAIAANQRYFSAQPHDGDPGWLSVSIGLDEKGVVDVYGNVGATTMLQPTGDAAAWRYDHTGEVGATYVVKAWVRGGSTFNVDYADYVRCTINNGATWTGSATTKLYLDDSSGEWQEISTEFTTSTGGVRLHFGSYDDAGTFDPDCVRWVDICGVLIYEKTYDNTVGSILNDSFTVEALTLDNETVDETGDGATLTIDSNSDAGTLYSYSKTTPFTGTEAENAAEIMANGVGQVPVVGTNTRVVTGQDQLTDYYAGWVQGSDGYGDDMVLVFNMGAGETLTIPGGAGTYLYDVDHGDGQTSTGLTTAGFSHTYTDAIEAVVRVSGVFPHLQFNNGGDVANITEIMQLGNVGWTSGNGAFYGAANATSVAIAINDASGLVDYSSMLRGLSSAGAMSLKVYDWDMTNATTLTSFLEGSQLSTATYDATLVSWGNQTLAAGAASTTIHFGTSQYTDVTSKQKLLEQVAGIIDGGQSDGEYHGDFVSDVQLFTFTRASIQTGEAIV